MKHYHYTRILFSFILILASLQTFACSCAPKLDFKTTDDLKSYDFIAHVKINKLAAFDSAQRYMRVRVNGKIKATVIEQFKGVTTSDFIDDAFRSDCALSIQEGEEWLFFGFLYEGKMQISKCSYSTLYRAKNGLRDWRYFSGIGYLDILRQLYNHPAYSNLANRQFYPYGNTEVDQHIKNGKLTGVRNIYYPDGMIYVSEDFKNGLRKSFRKTYDTSGHLLKFVKYKNGIKKQDIRYQDTAEHAWYLNFQVTNHNDPLFGGKGHDPGYFKRKLDSLRSQKDWDKQIAAKTEYADDGFSYQLSGFDMLGNLEYQGFLNWDKKLYEFRRFYKNGKEAMYNKLDGINDRDVEYDYKEDGSRREFDRKCESCKFYFNNETPAAAPEGIYVQ